VLPIGSWPNPSAPTSIAIGAIIGGCIGETIAWRRRYNADKTTRVAMKGSYYGTVLALIGYLGANLLETIFP
jgi:hypothetical protein